jgi:hypothetical protein
MSTVDMLTLSYMTPALSVFIIVPGMVATSASGAFLKGAGRALGDGVRKR